MLIFDVDLWLQSVKVTRHIGTECQMVVVGLVAPYMAYRQPLGSKMGGPSTLTLG